MSTGAARPAILALTQCLPYPPHTGVTNRIYHVLAGLQKRYDILLVPFVRRFHHPDSRAIGEARDALRRELTWAAEPIPIPAERSGIRRILNHLASLATRRPYIRFEYAVPGFGSALGEALRHRHPALVHAESLDLYDWFSRLPSVPLTVTHHSVESDLLRSRAAVTTSLPARAYLRLQAARLEALERHWCPRVTANLMMSDVDAERLRQVAPGAPSLVIPNGVDVRYFSPEKGRARNRSRVVFVGPTYVYQNREGVNWFLERIWPRIRRSVPDATLDLIGGVRDEDAQRYSGCPGVLVRGHVADLRPYLRDAGCSVAPLRVGGGTRLKILDAWAMETPVVSTTTGCEGLETVDGENILVRDDADSFADAVISLVRGPDTAARIGAAGRHTAVTHYSWDAVVRRLSDCYAELIG